MPYDYFYCTTNKSISGEFMSCLPSLVPTSDPSCAPSIVPTLHLTRAPSAMSTNNSAFIQTVVPTDYSSNEHPVAARLSFHQLYQPTLRRLVQPHFLLKYGYVVSDNVLIRMGYLQFYFSFLVIIDYVISTNLRRLA